MDSKWNLFFLQNLKINAGKFPSKEKEGYNPLFIKHREEVSSQETKRA